MPVPPTLYVSLVLPGQAAEQRADDWRAAVGAERVAVFSDASLKDVDRRVACWAMASREDIALIHGRFPIDSDRHVSRRVRFVCSLSDPCADIEKALRSWGGKRDLTEIDPDAVLAAPAAEGLINRQTRRLAGKAGKALSPSDPGLLEAALQNLREKFAWVGCGASPVVGLDALEATQEIELAAVADGPASDGGRFQPLIDLDLQLFTRFAATSVR